MIWSVLSIPSIFSRGSGLVLASMSSSVNTFLACEFLCALESRTAAATVFSELDVCGGAARDEGGVLCPHAAEAIASVKMIGDNCRRKEPRNEGNTRIALYRIGRPAREKGAQSASQGFPTCPPTIYRQDKFDGVNVR